MNLQPVDLRRQIWISFDFSEARASLRAMCRQLHLRGGLRDSPSSNQLEHEFLQMLKASSVLSGIHRITIQMLIRLHFTRANLGGIC